MRIVSLLPAATEIVYALGLGDELVGRTDACDYPPDAATVPVVARVPFPEGAAAGILRAGSVGAGSAVDAAAGGSGRLDVAALRVADPDLVLAGEDGGTRGADRAHVIEALRSWGSEAEVVTLEPTSIEGILHAITTVGAMTSAEDEAIGLVELLRERLGAIEAQVQRRRADGIRARRVVALAWLDPPYASGHWIPEQVRRAGGWDVIGREGHRAAETSWHAVMEVDPDQVLLMPFGLDARQAADAWERTVRPAAWHDLRAARNGEVFALDARSYFTRPGPRTIEGIALLAELFDPGGFVDQAPTEAWIPLRDA